MTRLHSCKQKYLQFYFEAKVSVDRLNYRRSVPHGRPYIDTCVNGATQCRVLLFHQSKFIQGFPKRIIGLPYLGNNEKHCFKWFNLCIYSYFY